MKTATLASPTITSGDMQASTMGMSTRGVDIASYFLRDRIYSDKILAFIREYICNAYDEHVKYDIKEPVLVEIKDVDGVKMWSCRDFAKGLSEHGIRNIFGMYFESTKSNSNESIGGFGIGSKSMMSYTDTFYINSHHEGTLTRYVATLGGGGNGVPVGEIYKISEEPTDESGIEISADISKDHYLVRNKTEKFVSNFHPNANIISREDSIETSPKKPISSKDLGDYTISQYDNPEWRNGFHIRMGGVIYSQNHQFRKIQNTLIYDIVIDVPIGKLSVPISRESFEDTPANQKVFSEIEDLLVQLMETEKETAKVDVPSLGSLLNKQSLKGETSSEYFKHEFSFLYPDTNRIWKYIEQNVQCNIPCCVNGKHLVYLFPDIKSIKSWEKRLNAVLTQIPDHVGYFFAKNTDKFKELVDSPELDLSDIQFVDVKSLGLPKLEASTGTQEFLVYQNGARRGKFTANSLEEFAAQKTNIELEDGWWENVETIDQLKSRAISLVESSYGGYGSAYTVKSKRFHAAMIELGWLDMNGSEYYKKATEIRDREKELELAKKTENEINNILFRIKPHPNLVKLVQKNRTKINKLTIAKNKILAENSTRAKILNFIDRNTYSYTTLNFTRADLRKIMALKD